MKSTFTYLRSGMQTMFFESDEAIMPSSFENQKPLGGSVSTVSTSSCHSQATTSDTAISERFDEIEVQLEEVLPSFKYRQSRKLPGTGYYSNNHIMVNTERTKRNIHPLTRKNELDSIARSHAETMADNNKLCHSNPQQLHDNIGQQTSKRLGQNIARGPSIRIIHKRMVDRSGDLSNMLDLRYTEFGMATALGENNELYLCQIFRG